ncbi:MAG: hypothetical protein LH480_09460 [Rubrivivax sp.]|nr:hypothetical protein [Rubrivivax sp.]
MPAAATYALLWQRRTYAVHWGTDVPEHMHMDAVYLGLTAALLALVFGLLRVCDALGSRP